MQVLFLSEDSIFLGDIPVCSQSSRIFFLTNVSCADTAHYEWDLLQHTNQQEEEGAKVAAVWLDFEEKHRSALFVWLCLTVTDHTNMACIHCCTSHYFILFLMLMSFDVLCQVVQIHPDRGRLCPGECALCVLTFTSTDYPTVHQLDIVCQVTQPHHRKV